MLPAEEKRTSARNQENINICSQFFSFILAISRIEQISQI